MKRFLLLLLAILLCFSVTACKKEAPKTDEISISTKEPETENETKNETQDVFSDSRYIGEYENEPVYQKIMEFETCSDPNELCELLEMLYGEAFSYSVMPCGEHTDHLYPIVALYHFGSKDHLDSDAYVFCKAESEEPLFVMDGDGTYIVSETTEGQSEDGDEYVGAWTTHESGDLIEIDADSCKEPFERQNRFEDENGNVLTVQKNDGNLLFYINDVLVGSPHGAPFAAGAKNEWLVYEIEPGDGLLLITRYPKDEYLYVQGDQAYCEFDGYYYS